MEFGTVKYLTQTEKIKDLWYSEVLYVTSAIVGLNTIAEIDYGSTGATFILITGIIVSSGIVPGAAQPVTYTDQYGRVLMVMDAGREGNGFYDIVQILESDKLRITANFATTYNFTVRHQYLKASNKR